MVYALNAENGSLIWSYKADGATYATPAVSEDKVFFLYAGGVFALDKENGDLLWKTHTGQGLDGSPVVAKNKLIAQNLYFLSLENGSILWKKPNTIPISTTGTASVDSFAVSNGMVFVPGSRGMYAFGQPTEQEQTNDTLPPWPLALLAIMAFIGAVFWLRKR